MLVKLQLNLVMAFVELEWHSMLVLEVVNLSRNKSQPFLRFFEVLFCSCTWLHKLLEIVIEL